MHQLAVGQDTQKSWPVGITGFGVGVIDHPRTGALADAAATAPPCVAAPAAGPSSTTPAPKATTARRNGPRIATPHYLPDGLLRGDAGEIGRGSRRDKEEECGRRLE